MLKNTSYKDKLAMLSPWLTDIVDTIKKDLRQEHLGRDWNFVKQYLGGKNPNKATVEELSEAYKNAVANGENGEDIAEFICNRWMLKHTDLYSHFEQELSKLFPNFSELEEIDEAHSKTLVANAVKEYGAPNTYQFCVINSVVFPKKVFEELSKKAASEADHAKKEETAKQELKTIEDCKTNYEQQIARLTDKYEKKLGGLQKKYTTDVDALKKQLATLQRKLTAG